MTKGINAFLLLMVLSATSMAGEKNLDSAYLRHDVSGRQKNSVVLPVVNEKYEYYEVCGGCEKDLQCELKQKCIRWNDGKKYDSVTNWKLKWDYGHRRTSEVCIADSFTVTVDVVYHLPKWAKAGDPPAPLVEKWSRYIDRLLLHEKGHRDRTVEAATELTRAVADLSPSRTCDELDRSVETLSHKRMDKLMEDQKAYDAETDHGAAQGAVFP